MRRSILLLLVLAATPAVAQTPAAPTTDAPAAAPVATEAPAAEAPAPEKAWTTEDLTSVRFEGERVPGPPFREGTEVFVLVRDGALARVASGDRFGWVDASGLSATPPGSAPTSIPTIQLGPSEP